MTLHDDVFQFGARCGNMGTMKIAIDLLSLLLILLLLLILSMLQLLLLLLSLLLLSGLREPARRSPSNGSMNRQRGQVKPGQAALDAPERLSLLLLLLLTYSLTYVFTYFG